MWIRKRRRAIRATGRRSLPRRSVRAVAAVATGLACARGGAAPRVGEGGASERQAGYSAIDSVSVERANAPLVFRMTVNLARAAALAVEYWTGGSGRLLVASGESKSHTVYLARLSPGATYDYEIYPMVDGERRSPVVGTFVTDALPTGLADFTFDAEGTPSFPLLALELRSEPFSGSVVVNADGDVVWYRARPDNYSPVVGSAIRLRNGNTVVTFGVSETVSNSIGPIEVYEVDGAGGVQWRLLVRGPSTMYRATPLAGVSGEVVVRPSPALALPANRFKCRSTDSSRSESRR